MSMTARRFAATAVDYALAAGWAGTLLLALWILVDPPDAPTSGAGQFLGFIVLTVPVTVGLAYLDARGGSPGKRLVGLRLRTRDDEPPSQRQSLVRTTGRIGLPWELAHTGVWRIYDSNTDHLTVGLILAAYLLPLCAAIAVFRGRTAWYDLIARTTVSPSPRETTP
jgi:uncharacterized RDD family membrane protein YckC